MSTSKEVKECYISTLADLMCNSKPLINVLTILAEENIAHAADIVETIESHLAKVDKEIKLPILYLIDCIMKNVGGTYTSLFSNRIVTTFCNVFEVVDEKTRAEMFKLRQTWNDVLPKSKLYSLDMKVNQMDPAWPIVTPTVANNIHLNPKFLQNTSIPKKSPPIAAMSTPTAAVPSPIMPPEVDMNTLDMQKKLLLKQQQLLELQQKRLELEVLQTQVKLQEQMKTNFGNSKTADSAKVGKSQNLLLKPEVAKQLNNTTGSTIKNKSLNTSGAMNKKTSNQGGVSANSSLTRIAPVNSALLAAANNRQTRDPRLLRLQNSNNNTTVNSNVQLENKNNNTTDTLGSNTNKAFNNKVSVQAKSTEPRLVSNKGSVSPQNKSKVLTQSPKKSKSDSSSSKAIRSSRGASKPTSSSKGSTSSLDSPNKGKSGKGSDSKTGRSPSISPVKQKKRDKEGVSSRSDKKAEKLSKIGTSSSSSSSSSLSSSVNAGKSDKEIKSPSSKIDSSPPTFKEFKSNAKTRNYIRRNRDLSVSPEPAQDVDLRLNGPPEKQPRLQSDATEEKGQSARDVPAVGMDVDLRQMPGLVNKKRPSVDALEPNNSKKSKSEVFDELFGNEDTDLRQLPTVITSPLSTQDRPPTPPPPIISLKTNEDNDRETKKTESPKSNNLDFLRAKLANATNREKMKERISEQKSKAEDTDLRNSSTDDSFNKIIISSADEQSIKMGNMTKEQEKALMNKILAQIENQKLNEAKRKDCEENIGNISLQPISDDEFEADFSASSDEETAAFRRKVYVDKDDRLPSVNPVRDNYKYPRLMDRDVRRGLWRGRPMRSRGGIMARGIRPGRGGENWGRPMNGPWKPMQGGYLKPHHPMYVNEIIDVDNISEQEKPFEIPELVLDCANQDNTKSINIDGCPRDIRYYEETAVVFMSSDDPREISFQNGSRKVSFDEKDIYILSFNEPYTEVMINGSPHNVRLGGPTREIFIDGKWYECYYGGPPVAIDLDGKLTYLKMDGPAPQVKIGTNVRKDLVAGKIDLIVDAKTVISVYLDGKVQKFEIEGKVHTLKFIDSLKTVLINDIPFNVEFGGLPKPVMLQDKKHFVRFSVLPKGVKPGHVKIKDMEGSSATNSPRHDSENSMDTFPVVDTNEPALPIFTKKRKHFGGESPDRNSNSPLPFQNLLQQSDFTNLNMLSSMIPSTILPNQSSMSGTGYQVENITSEPPLTQHQEIAPSFVPATPVVPVNPPAPTLNINELLQKLVASGVITTSTEQMHNSNNTPQVPLAKPPPAIVPNIPPLQAKQPFFPKRDNTLFTKMASFDKIDTLKIRQSMLYHNLYSGMPCSSCGMRFPPEQSMQYSQHLDWHFRQNRKGKKNIRKAASRKWYYSKSDWKNYEEIEDLEEREKSYFENQQHAQADGGDEAEEEVEMPSVPSDPNVTDPCCEVCHDRFDQFYNEEKEEWHLKHAISIDGKTYHPLCYEDYQASLVEATDDALIEKDEGTQDGVIPGLEVSPDDEDNSKAETSEIVIDDDESERVSQISEQVDEKVEEQTQDAFASEPEEDGDDDDVILNEITPEKIDLVDDDKYDDLPTQNDSFLGEKIKVKEEPIDDGFMEVEGCVLKFQDFENVKIKSEPIDEDELMEVVETQEEAETKKEALNAELVAALDGNVEFDSNVKPTSGISGKIKINITKPLPVIAPKESSTNKELSCENERSGESIDPSQPLPPGEEPIQLNLKHTLQGVELKKLPAVKKGTELSGLCSIM